MRTFKIPKPKKRQVFHLQVLSDKRYGRIKLLPETDGSRTIVNCQFNHLLLLCNLVHNELSRN